MTPNFARRNASMILGLMLATVSGFSKTPVRGVPVTVHLLDYVNLPAAARSDLVATAKRVLNQAGVAVEFLECLADGTASSSPDCTAPLRPTDLIVRIFQPRLALRSDLLGYALVTPEGGAFVTVFINPQERRARADSLSDGILFGHTVAHEIGHLLMGTNSHSSSGIMRPSWRLADEGLMAKGVLVFDTSQARRMRSALAARACRGD